MCALKFRSEIEEKQDWELEGNKLIIRVNSEGAFLANFEEKFWQLMHSEQSIVTLDVSRCEGLDLEAYQMIALQMFELGNSNKELIILIPENLERYFKNAGLYRVAEILSVKFVGKKTSDEDAQAAIEDAVQQLGKDIQEAEGVSTSQLDSSLDKSSIKNKLKSRFAEHVESEREKEKEKARSEIRTGKGRLLDKRTGQIVEINKNPTKIGRIPGNDIIIASAHVSKKHTMISYADNHYYIEDVGSSNGTYLDGQRITEKQPLYEGAVIVIAITRKLPKGAKEYVFKQDKT